LSKAVVPPDVEGVLNTAVDGPLRSVRFTLSERLVHFKSGLVVVLDQDFACLDKIGFVVGMEGGERLPDPKLGIGTIPKSKKALSRRVVVQDVVERGFPTRSLGVLFYDWLGRGSGSVVGIQPIDNLGKDTLTMFGQAVAKNASIVLGFLQKTLRRGPILVLLGRRTPNSREGLGQEGWAELEVVDKILKVSQGGGFAILGPPDQEIPVEEGVGVLATNGLETFSAVDMTSFHRRNLTERNLELTNAGNFTNDESFLHF
jgi:hypothetical protein